MKFKILFDIPIINGCSLFLFNRLVGSHSRRGSSVLPLAAELITFSVRCGTSEGVVSHHLRTETHRDLANWARALVQGAHDAVQTEQEIAFRKYHNYIYLFHFSCMFFM